MRTEVEAPGVEPRDVSGGVTVTGVQKAFGAVKALDGVSLRAAPREVVAVAGPSGCGKSTLLELVCGLAQADAGTIEAPPAALMPQRDGLLPWLNALDNAALALRVGGAGRSAARASARDAPATRSARPALSSALSHGSRPSRWGISAAGGASIVPASGACSPHTSSSSVDFPHPLGPTTASVSPGRARSDTSLSASTAPKRFATPASVTPASSL